MVSLLDLVLQMRASPSAVHDPAQPGRAARAAAERVGTSIGSICLNGFGLRPSYLRGLVSQSRCGPTVRLIVDADDLSATVRDAGLELVSQRKLPQVQEGRRGYAPIDTLAGGSTALVEAIVRLRRRRSQG